MSLWSPKDNKDGTIEWKTTVKYNTEESIKNLNPKGRGSLFARGSDIDNTDSSLPTTDENEFIDDVNSYIHNLNEISTNQVTIVNKEVVRLLDFEKYRNIMSKFKENATNLVTSFKYDEKKVQEERNNASSDLMGFRSDNNLHGREIAVYPESKLYHIAIIIAFIIIEAMVNSYFFGNASDLGLLGGFFTGLMTSLANVMLGIIAGFLFLRLGNHIDTTKKIIGKFFFALLLPIIFFLHLLIAHYRELLIKEPNSQIFSVINRVIEQPFGLQDLDSIILIVVGVFISIIAVWKGYTLDDPYPGYGEIYRRWKEKDDSMYEAQKNLILSVTAEYNNAIKDSHNIYQNFEKNKLEVEEIKKDMNSFFDGYLSYYQQARDGALRLIDIYRQEIRFVRRDETIFQYNENLLLNLEKPNLEMKKRTETLIETTLTTISNKIDDFEEEQNNFERKLIQEKDEFIGNKAIEEMFSKMEVDSEEER